MPSRRSGHRISPAGEDDPRDQAAPALADEGRCRRLKITGASPGPSELATLVRVGATEQVLRLPESSTAVSVDHRRDTPSIDAAGVQRA